jgi:hypothetical protein
MSDLITRAMEEKRRIDAERQADAVREADELTTLNIAATRDALTEVLAVSPEHMVDVRDPWAGVRVGDLHFVGHFNRGVSWVRLVAPCPDCGGPVGSERIWHLYDLAEVIEKMRSGKRHGYNNRPVWIEYHECSARASAPEPEAAPAPTLEQRLAAVIREIVNEVVDGRGE